MVTTRQRITHILVWLLFFGAFSSLLLFVGTSRCACGHGGMDTVPTVALFGGFTIGGLACWRWIASRRESTGPRGVLASIAMMVVGFAAALLFGGGEDMQTQHQNMFQPADSAVVGDVEF